jgi:hypothetical protein
MLMWESIVNEITVNSVRFAGIFAVLLVALVGTVGWEPTSAQGRPPAVDQYVEQLPSPGGERPAGAGGEASAGGLDGGALAALLALGDEGPRAAVILGSLDTGSSSGSGTEPVDTAKDDSSIGDVIGASGFGGSGMGLVLPLSMLAVVILGFILRPLGRPPETRGPSAGD